MSMVEPMSKDMSMMQKSALNDDMKNLSHLENDNLSECHSKTCYEMCKISSALAITKTIKYNTTPIYISSILNIDYNFSNNEVKLNELYRPPQYFSI